MRLGLIAALLFAPGTLVAQLRLVPFDIRVPKNPFLVAADGQNRLVYELRITNIGRRGYGLKRLEVSAGGQALAAFEGDSLRGMTLRMGETGDGRQIGAGKQTLIYVLVSTPSAPKSLEHRLLLTPIDSLAGPTTDTLSGFQVAVDATPVPVVRAPLAGGPWLAANGPGNTSGHRRTVIPLEGQGRIAQRFATDWVKYGPDGRLWQGDSTKNENWYGYRAPLLAVAPGRVVAVKDGIPDNVPLAPNRAVPITLETVGGNHVIIDLGGGFYAFYAHIVAGSITVKVGDQVKVGQVVGLLGNSGNSDAPHLHFHLGDRPSPLGTEGLPFLIDGFEKLGVSKGFESAVWVAEGPAEAKRRELPLDNHVVRFKP